MSVEQCISGKTKLPAGETTSQFKFQSEPNSCYTVSIYNILHDLSIRHNNHEIGFPESKVNQICRYRNPWGPVPEAVVPNLNKSLKEYGYRTKQQNRRSFENMLTVLKDADCSYPLIGFSAEYLIKEQGVKELESVDSPDHVVIVMSADAKETAFFDPFEGLLRKRRKRDNNSENGIVSLPTSKTLNYWAKAGEPSWMFWAEKIRKSESPTLSLFPQGALKES